MKARSIAQIFNISFIASSSIIFAGAFVVNFLNYVFTLIISRLMGVEAFGEVTALFSLLLIISVPAAALTMLMTREAAFRKEQGIDSVRDLFVFLRQNILTAALIFWALFLVCVPLLSFYLQIHYTLLLIFSLLIPVTAASSLQSGTLQGMQEFFLLSKQNVLSAVIKLVASIILVKLGFSVAGVMFGLVLASLSSWGYGYLSTNKVLQWRGKVKKIENLFSIGSMGFSTILGTTLLLALLSNVDVILAKHYLSPLLAGEYGALSTIGKILIYGVGAFITVLLPMVSATQAGDAKGKKILYFSLSIIALCSLAAYSLFYFFSTPIISILFGARYLAVAPYLAPFSIAMACISLSTALINYFIATRNTSFLFLLLAGILIEIVLISLDHATLGAMATMLIASSATLLLLMAANYLIFYRKKI